MKITGINITGTTQVKVQVGTDNNSRPVYGMENGNEYTLTIEEETPLKYTTKNKIEVPVNLVDELETFIEEFTAKCKKEYVAMQGLLY